MAINARRDSGLHSLGEIWRRHHLSCPTREQLGSFLLGVLADDQAGFVTFHLELSGCRTCLANLDDLKNRQTDEPTAVDTRRKKYFQSSAGHLRKRESARSRPAFRRLAGRVSRGHNDSPRIKCRPSNAGAGLLSPPKQKATQAMQRTAILWGCLAMLLGGARRALDLSKAVVVAPDDLTAQEKKAVTMLVDEVERRSHVRWKIADAAPGGQTPIVAVGPKSSLAKFAGKAADALARQSGGDAAEGFRIRTSPAGVVVAGNDARGVLFGIGYLLRHLHMADGKITLDDDTNVTTAPKYPLRGHQLGYRPKTNSYDAWDLPVWEQYYRDLAVFGCNAVELIPPRSDDAATSPHFPLPPLEMMVGMSRSGRRLRARRLDLVSGDGSQLWRSQAG